MLTRIRYAKLNNEGDWVSTRNYILKNDKVARVYIRGNTYTIEQLDTGQIVASGSSNNYIVLRRKAKRDLIKVMKEDLFNRELRTRLDQK